MKSEFTLKYKEAYNSMMSLDNFEEHPPLDDFDESDANYMTTTFSYPLNEDSAGFIDDCITNFKSCIGKVMAFNHKINSVKITDRRNGQEEVLVYKV
jgi:hypothetical protein